MNIQFSFIASIPRLFRNFSLVNEAIVEEARKRGFAGATVLRGFLGFGANSRIHTFKVLRLSEDLPVVIEIIDAEDKIKAFLPTLDKMITEGLVTLEKLQVIVYRHNTREKD